MMRTTLAVTLILVCSSREFAQRGPDVPNFPTPEAAVDAMLKLAKVGKDDVVYDLGCGDGRIVIAAAKQCRARGVGGDIDPQCVRDSRANAIRAGVDSRVQFSREDLFKTDISKATVVALYLSPELTRRLIPKLLKELKPGTRVVAHVYDMGDWEPDTAIPVPGSKQFKLFLWTIPADLRGEWRWSANTSSGPQSDTFRLDQRYQKLSGVVNSGGHPLSIDSASVSGLNLTIRAGNLEFAGMYSGDRVRGTLTVRSGDRTTTVPFNARGVSRAVE